MNIDPQPWFGAKRHGYGWSPRSWKGWLAIALYVVMSIASVQFLLLRNHGVAALVCHIALTAALVALCMIRREAPSRPRGGS